MANTKIRHEIVIFPQASTRTSSAEMSWWGRVEPAKYSGTCTWYLEAVVSVTSGLTGRVHIYDSSNVDYGYIEVTETTPTAKRVQLTSLSSADKYNLYVELYSGTGTVSFQEARIVCVQETSSVFTATQSQFLLGSTTNVTGTTYGNPYPRYWKYTAANWDGTISPKLFVVGSSSNTSYTASFQLQTSSDLSSWSDVSGGLLTTTSSSANGYITSDNAFTLVDGNYYRIVMKSNNASGIAYIRGAALLLDQAATSITKLEEPFCIFGYATGAGYYVAGAYYSDEWSNASNTYKYVQYTTASNTSKLINYTDTVDIVSITGTGYTISDSFTMVDNLELLKGQITTYASAFGGADVIAYISLATNYTVDCSGYYGSSTSSSSSATISGNSSLTSVVATTSCIAETPSLEVYIETPLVTVNTTAYAPNAFISQLIGAIVASTSSAGQSSIAVSVSASSSVATTTSLVITPVLGVSVTGTISVTTSDCIPASISVGDNAIISSILAESLAAGIIPVVVGTNVYPVVVCDSVVTDSYPPVLDIISNPTIRTTKATSTIHSITPTSVLTNDPIIKPTKATSTCAGVTPTLITNCLLISARTFVFAEAENCTISLNSTVSGSPATILASAIIPYQVLAYDLPVTEPTNISVVAIPPIVDVEARVVAVNAISSCEGITAALEMDAIESPIATAVSSQAVNPILITKAIAVKSSSSASSIACSFVTTVSLIPYATITSAQAKIASIGQGIGIVATPASSLTTCYSSTVYVDKKVLATRTQATIQAKPVSFITNVLTGVSSGQASAESPVPSIITFDVIPATIDAVTFYATSTAYPISVYCGVDLKPFTALSSAISYKPNYRFYVIFEDYERVVSYNVVQRSSSIAETSREEEISVSERQKSVTAIRRSAIIEEEG